MIAALICGRAETQPFPGRNKFPLLGRPLLSYAALAATHSENVERVYLTTDDPALAEIGRHHGLSLIDRPPALRAPDVHLKEIFAHGARRIAEDLGAEPEMLVVLLANAPTVTHEIIDQGVEMLRADPSLDAVMTVSAQKAYHPAFALRLGRGNLLWPYAAAEDPKDDVYFPTALLWVVRPAAWKPEAVAGSHALEIVDPRAQRVAPLVHEGYGDVDYVWQIPAVEEWLRRHGFSETVTPYEKRTGRPAAVADWRASLRDVPSERRVLVSTAPFGDPDREPLEILRAAGAACVVNPFARRLKEEELAELIADFGILIAGTEPVTAKVIAAAPHLRLIARVGVGLDSVDLAAARSRRIPVTYTPEAPAPAVSELTVGLMLALLRHIPAADRQLRHGVWHRFLGERLAGLTVGVIGAGRIGARVIRHLAGGFPGVRLLANDLRPDPAFDLTGVRWAEKDEIYRESDILTLHLPLTPQTRNLLSAEAFRRMKPTALLVNTSRGGIVNERDLAEALRAGRLAGAAIDVFEREPYAGELTALSQCVLTCHMGSMSRDCRRRMEMEAAEEAVRFLKGEPLRSLVPEEEYALAQIHR